MSGRIFRLALLVLPRRVRERRAYEFAHAHDELLREAGSSRARRLWVTLISVLDVVRSAPGAWLGGGDRPRGAWTFGSELQYAARSAVRRPASSLLVVIMMALGVAASSAVFTVVNGLLVRPLPWPDSERIVYLNETAPKWNLEYVGINYADFATWQESAQAFEAMALVEMGSLNVGAGEQVERLDASWITREYLDVLQLQPVLGRAFTAEEDTPNGPRVVAISEDVWRNRFSGRMDVLGSTVRLNSAEHVVVAVYPRVAAYPDVSQLWVPLQGDPLEDGSYSYDGIARLKPGVTIEAARADLVRAHEPTYEAHDDDRIVSPVIMPLREFHFGDVRPLMFALFGGVLVVLLIACANVASVMLARAVATRREVGIRLAIGAAPARLGWQQLAESLVLAVAGSAVGTVLGYWGTRMLLRALPEDAPPWLQFGLDVRVLLFVFVVTAAAAWLAAIAPMLQAVRTSPSSALAGSANTRSTASGGQKRLLNGLVIAEISLATVLLVSGGLLLRAYQSLQNVEPGFRTENVLRFRLQLPESKYANETVMPFMFNVVDGVRAIPGVLAAGAVTCPPLSCHQGNFFEAEGAAPRGEDEQNPVVQQNAATAEYGTAVGMTMLRGRFLSEGEVRSGAMVAVVNESFAELNWPGGNAIGRRFKPVGDNDQWYTVVGIAADMRHYGLDEDARPTIFHTPWRPQRAFAFLVHTGTDPMAVVSQVRAAVRALDPEVPLYRVETAREALDASLGIQRVISRTLAIFAGSALLLAIGGIYGVLSYVMGQRAHELGIRLALGARPAGIMRLVFRHGAGLALAGTVIGVALAALAARALQSLLFGVAPGDAMTWMAVLLMIAAGSLAAVLGPALRAAHVDPQRALRQS